MYVASDTEEEEGSPEGEGEIPGEGLSDLESIEQEGAENSGCIAGSAGPTGRGLFGGGGSRGNH